MTTAPSSKPQSATSAAADRPTPVAVAEGDGIGPEITGAVLRILEAAGARLDVRPLTLGAAVYEQGHTAGIAPDAWPLLSDVGVLLKGPITTPSGGGYKSLNVTLRKTLGLFANVRPCVGYDPAVPTRFPGMDVVIIRENEEDTYAGIEHRQTAEVTQCLKLITRPGCERICRYAFAYAKAHGRKRVTCMVKDNIHKLTDGLFAKVFSEVAGQHPEIESDRAIIDIGAARLADTPNNFDVIVTLNLYGDIISDIAAQISGSVGMVGTANVGATCSMFEAVHGSAPDIAGQDKANPSGLLLAAVQMLVHIGQGDVAGKVHNAWLRTIEDGVHTGDIFDPARNDVCVGTAAFGDAVIERLGQFPQLLAPVRYDQSRAIDLDQILRSDAPAPVKQRVGVDLFLDWHQPGRDPNVLGARLEELGVPGVKLKMITNRGVKVYPEGNPATFCTDHWRCRFVAESPGAPVDAKAVVALHQAAVEAGLDVIKSEHLFTFDGELGYSLGQGE